jgi:hypothetical protein
MGEAKYGELDDMGPVDYLCIEFPQGSLNGKSLPLLLDLVDQRTIRVLDMVFVRKSPDGTMVALGGRELELNGLGAFHGAASGMLGGDDLREAGEVLEPGAAAVIIVYENLWAAPLARSLREAGARLIAGGRIPVQELLAALDETEAEAARASVTTGR